MNLLWRQLSGPNAFLKRVASDIRDGKNVIIRTPQFGPKKIFQAIKREFLADDDLDCRTITISTPLCFSPTNYLYTYFCPDIPPVTNKNIRNLIHKDTFSGKIIWINNLVTEDWSKWLEFLTDYEAACRNVSHIERTVLCFIIDNVSDCWLPQNDVCLSIHYWEDCVDSIDMSLYASRLLKEKNLSILEQDLIIHTIQQLALWDFEFATHLANQKPEDIINPLPIIENFAKIRNWNGVDELSHYEQWCCGVKNKFNDNWELHSAALHVLGQHDVLLKRLWRAQVKAIFPLIEDIRQKILESIKPFLKIPFETFYGKKKVVIENFHDLEIRHLFIQIKDSDVIPVKYQGLIGLIRDIRNDLAHQKPTSADNVLNLINYCTEFDY
jgi:hypothetical protein